MNPNLQLTGIDINTEAIRQGRELLSGGGTTNVRLEVGGIDLLRTFPDGAFDIFPTDAVLMYVGPDAIRQVLSEGLRLSRLAMISLEWHRDSPVPLRWSSDRFVQGHWVRDYRRYLSSIAPRDRVRTEKLPNGIWPGALWSRFGYLIEVDHDAN